MTDDTRSHEQLLAEIERLQGCVTDQRVRIEELEIAESHVAYLKAAIPEVVFVHDREGRYLDVLTDDTDSLFRAVDDFQGKLIPDVFEPDLAAFFYAFVTQAFESGQRETTEYALGVRAGQRWFAATARAVTPPGATEPVVVFSARDVTDRVTANKALQASEERHRKFYIETPAILHSIDGDGKLISVSQKWLEVLGYAEDEVLGRASLDFLTPTSAEFATTQGFPSLYRDGFVDDVPIEFVTKSGEIVDVLISAKLETDELSGAQRTLAVAVNVTENKKLEAQVRHSQKMEAVGNLASGVAHDFNNLLTGILGATQLAQLDLDANHPSYSELDQVVEICESASRLTQKLLTFSRQSIIVPRVLDVNQQVHAIHGFLGRLLCEDVTLNLDLGDNVAPVLIDQVQLEQLIVNLAVNARDAMPQGGQLDLRTRTVVTNNPKDPSRTPEQYVRLTVGDNGSGIPDDVLPSIFNPFYTTKLAKGGTGLGLATVHGITEQNGGFVSVETIVGEGTTFHVHLPSTDQDQSVEVVAGDENGISSGSETLLFIEDNDAIRVALARLLERVGYNVVCASDYKSVLPLYAKHGEEIDLIISDVVMPGMNGPEIIEALRPQPTCPILFMSGHCESDIHEKGVLNLGVNFLAKPFSRDVLLRRVRKLLAGVEA